MGTNANPGQGDQCTCSHAYENHDPNNNFVCQFSAVPNGCGCQAFVFASPASPDEGADD